MNFPLPAVDVWVQGLLLMLWAVAAACAFSITRRSTQAELRRRARLLLWLLLPAVPLTAASVLMMSLPDMSRSGSLLQEGLLLQAPLLLVSAAGVLLFTLPRLWTMVRYIGSGRKAPTREQRDMTTDPYFVTPLLAAACSTACSLYYAVAPPLALSLSWRQMLLPVLILILLVSLFSLVQLRHHRRSSIVVPARRLAPARLNGPLPVARQGDTAVAVGWRSRTLHPDDL
ncbi:hypothetical protein [Paenibacillus daejeonensis]|uniref:hypothetical protein n=1 Tax=Paenibacillus daejeonensis TaxID=135193 RepID=UPI000362348A|nr:hypothetical protein [Paenibacillus daejeonensis]